jgi:hypothetical protein
MMLAEIFRSEHILID